MSKKKTPNVVYKVKVVADNSGLFVGNGLTFPTVEAAREYGADLAMRWTLVRRWAVYDQHDVMVGEPVEV